MPRPRPCRPRSAEGTFAGLFDDDRRPPSRITPAVLVSLQTAAAAEGVLGPVVLDVRARSSYEGDDGQIPGSIRVPPDQVTDWAAEWQELHDRDRMIVAVLYLNE